MHKRFLFQYDRMSKMYLTESALHLLPRGQSDLADQTWPIRPGRSDLAGGPRRPDKPFSILAVVIHATVLDWRESQPDRYLLNLNHIHQEFVFCRGGPFGNRPSGSGSVRKSCRLQQRWRKRVLSHRWKLEISGKRQRGEDDRSGHTSGPR